MGTPTLPTPQSLSPASEGIPPIPTPKETEPVKNELVKNEPVRNEPVRNEPVRNEPVRNEPVKNELVKEKPPIQKVLTKKETKPTKPTQLAVLGMHHSATSVLSRVLVMMGFWGGEIEDYLIKASDPRKFWERRDVVQAEQWLINQVIPGKDHEGPRWTGYGFDKNRMTDALSSRFGLEMKKIVDKLNEFRPWFTKDPRMCLMFDMWKPYLDSPACLIVYRHPVVLAKRSMDRFEGLRLNQWIQLWENYTLSALESCQGVPTTLISQSHLEDDAYKTIQSFYFELGRLGFDISNSSLPNLPPLSKAILPKQLLENQTSLTKYLYLPKGALSTLRIPPKAEIGGFLFPPDSEKFPPRPPITQKELRLLTNRQYEMYQNFEDYFQKYPTLHIPTTELAATLLPEQKAKKQAYAVLVTSTDPSYVVGAAVIGSTLEKIDPSRDRIALVLPSVTEQIRALLRFAHFQVREVEPVTEYYTKYSPLCQENQADLDTSRRHRWGKMFSKLRIWELVEYDRVLYLDCDALPHESIEFLFDIQAVPVIAEPGTAHNGFNAGFLLIEPSRRTFEDMIKTLEFQKTNKSFPVVFQNVVDCTEQSFLNDFFPYFHPVKIARAHNTTKGQTPLAHWITTRCPKPWSAKCSIVQSCNPPIYQNWWRSFEMLDKRIASLATSPKLTPGDKTVIQIWELSKKDGTVSASICGMVKKPSKPPNTNANSDPKSSSATKPSTDENEAQKSEESEIVDTKIPEEDDLLQ